MPRDGRIGMRSIIPLLVFTWTSACSSPPPSDFAPRAVPSPTPRNDARGSGAPPRVEANRSELYVWARVERRGRVVTRIERDDLVRKLGSRGWPGCPADGICTRFGQLSLEILANGRFELTWNAPTSSDFVRSGRVAERDGTLQLEFDEVHSCAHPGTRLPTNRVVIVDAERGDDTWTIAIAPPRWSPWPLDDRPRDDTRVVFRRVSSERERRALRFRACQPEPGASCHPACDR